MSSLSQNIKDIKRLEQIIAGLIKCELGFLVDKLKLRTINSKKKKTDAQNSEVMENKTNPEQFVKLFEELGGSFIKLGQLLSIRPDLLPPEYCNAFRKLQDTVPAFPSEEAIAIVETELGMKINEAFAFFNPSPMAAASIGQVHKARLITGEFVAVKIQRPNIKSIIETDVDILKHIAKLIQNHYKPEIFDPIAIVDEFERYTKNELDFSMEARNIEKFRKNFQDEITVKIPRVYEKLSTQKVLTTEFIEGVKTSELIKISKERKNKIADRIVGAVMKQVFVHGVFHADPHPGNILILKDDRIAFLDFGIVGYFDEELTEKVTFLFTALIQGKIEDIYESLIALGVVDINTETSKLKKDVIMHLGKYYNASLKDLDFSVVFTELLTLARKNKLKLPTDLVLLGKAIITVEGVAEELNPNFDLVKFSKPFARDLALQKLKPAAIAKKVRKASSAFKNFFVNIPSLSDELLKRLRSSEKNMNEIDHDLRVLTYEMDKSSNRIAIGMVVTGFLIASALMYTVEIKVFKGFPIFSGVGFIISLILLLGLVISILREKRFD